MRTEWRMLALRALGCCMLGCRKLGRGMLAATAALALFTGLDLALVSPGPAPSHAVETPLELKWSQLVPPALPSPPKSFLAGRPPGMSAPANPHDGAAA